MDFDFKKGTKVIIQALFDAGATKEQTLDFLREILENPIYIGNDELKDKLIIEKLGVDVFIALNKQQ